MKKTKEFLMRKLKEFFIDNEYTEINLVVFFVSILIGWGLSSFLFGKSCFNLFNRFIGNDEFIALLIMSVLINVFVYLIMSILWSQFIALKILKLEKSIN